MKGAFLDHYLQNAETIHANNNAIAQKSSIMAVLK